MTHLLAITMTATLLAGQAPGPEEAPGAAPNTFEARRAVLEQALADFEAAVAMKGPTSPAAQRLYRRALAGFESASQGGVDNGRLFYNVANTYLRLGEVGKAIVNYRRALRLMPGDEQIRRNLNAARNLCRVQIPPRATSALVETLFFWHFGVSLAARTKVALAGYVLCWGLMLVRLFALRRAAGYAWTIRVVTAITLVIGASITWDSLARHRRHEGVIITDEVVLRKGNGEYYEPQLEQTLSEGVEFRLIETRNDVDGTPWYRVELRDGKKGWLPAGQADVISPTAQGHAFDVPLGPRSSEPGRPRASRPGGGPPGSLAEDRPARRISKPHLPGGVLSIGHAPAVAYHDRQWVSTLHETRVQP